MSREDLLKMLLIDFGVMSVDDLKSGRLNGASRPELSYPLYEFLNALVPLQAFAVLVIDEAQNLSMSLLEEIRILSDLEGPEKLLQVVLVGQLEFLPKLKDPQMRQFDQRVSVRCQLQALDRDAVAGYITHRLGVAGGGTDRVNFSLDAVDIIYRATNGNPRLINLVCDKALHHGHLTRTFSIGADLVKPGARRARGKPSDPGTHRTQRTRRTERTSAPGPPEPIDEFVHETNAVSETPALPATMADFAEETQEPSLDQVADATQNSGRRVMPLIVAAVMALAIGASMLFGWQRQQAALVENLTMPEPPAAPARRSVTPVPTPPTLLVQPNEIATVASGTGAFEVGVAQFSAPSRAIRLEAELAASGYRASTWSVDFDSGRLYEVRIGPYSTRDAAEADATRIREMRGYEDARVMASSSAAH